MKKIGLLGGSFNPIHMGHLLLAESARDQFGLERVVFIPAGKNPFKQKNKHIDREHRLNMVKLAVESNPYFEVSDIELRRPGISYTVDTIDEIAKEYPDSALYFITGADIMFEITLWKEAERLLKTVNFITTFRPGYSHRKLDERIEELEQTYHAHIFKLFNKEMDIASTDIRGRIQNGHSIKYLLPEKVEAYICQHKLYLPKQRQGDKMDYASINKKLKKALKPKRYHHTLGVVECALEMAKKYNCNLEKVRYAAILHDCAKNYSDAKLLEVAKRSGLELDAVTIREPQLLHGPVGAVVAKEEYGVDDADILAAIAYHTTGRVNMTKLEKIIYLADFIEPSRDYPGVDTLRQMAFENLDDAMIQALTNTIRYITKIGGLIHERTVTTRNAMILKKWDRVESKGDD